MRIQSGYWWAISIRQEDDRPEIIDVGSYSFGQMANRVGDADPFDLIEFELLQWLDASLWPMEGAVDPSTVREGYWWALDRQRTHIRSSWWAKIEQFEPSMAISIAVWTSSNF